MRHVNPAFFGLPRTVDSIRDALMLLGTRAVRQCAYSDAAQWADALL